MTDLHPAAREAARTVARILLEIEAVLFRPSDPFILTSGRASPVYIDCRKIIAFPRARRKVIELAAAAVEREIGFESLDAVAGGETAGIPYAAWISDALMLPMQYVRKKPKGFGRMAQIEGDLDRIRRNLPTRLFRALHYPRDHARLGEIKRALIEDLSAAGEP